MEYGIFNDEGCVEGGFASEAEAKAAIEDRYSDEDDLHVAEACHNHPEHEKESCEDCEADDEDEDDEDDEDET
jgi:hypothetical protein